MSIQAPGGLTEYIQHHLHWNTVEVFGRNFHLDSWIMGMLLAVIFCAWFYRAARKATSGVPSKSQAFVEIIVEFADGQVKDMFHGDRSFLAPFALAIFMWVLFMNLIDVVPIDIVGGVVTLFGGHSFAESFHFKPVATADPYTTFAMSLTVFVLTFFYGIKAKGGMGFAKEQVTSPFKPSGPISAIVLAVPNIILNLVEHLSKPISLSMRLFGNMFGGELVFMLIAGLLSSWLTFGFGVVFGFAWSVFELLIIVLQAYIFMVLSVAYLALAQEHH